MKNTHIYKTLILIGLITSAQSVFAIDKVDYVDLQKGGININDGKIEVKPVNGNYSQVTTSKVPFNVQMRAGCKGQNILQQGFVSYGKEGVSKTILESSNNYRKAVFVGTGKTLPWTDVKLEVPLNKIGFNAVALCQDMMNKKIQQGIAKHQILASDQIIERSVDLMAVASCGQNSSNVHYGADTVATKAIVVCKAGPMPTLKATVVEKPGPALPGGQIANKGEITKVAFEPVKVNNTGACPMNVEFNGEIAMNGVGTAKYRVKFPGNQYTGWRTLKFAKAGTLKIPTVKYQATQSLPNAQAVLEVEEPAQKKVFKNFNVTCVKGGGADQINAPGNGGGIQLKKIQPR